MDNNRIMDKNVNNTQGVSARTREGIKSTPRGGLLTSHAETSEKVLEERLADRLGKMGILCLKYANSAEAGYPDRVVVFPRGTIEWVELKSTGKKPRRLQELRHRQLRGFGHKVYVLSSREEVDRYIRHAQRRYELFAAGPDQLDPVGEEDDDDEI